MKILITDSDDKRISALKQILIPYGNPDILKSAKIIEKTDIVISNDHGIVHLASALARPVISLGPVYPEVWQPWSKKSTYLRAELKCIHNCPGADICLDYRCCKEIEVDDVLKEIKRILSDET